MDYTTMEKKMLVFKEYTLIAQISSEKKAQLVKTWFGSLTSRWLPSFSGRSWLPAIRIIGAIQFNSA